MCVCVCVCVYCWTIRRAQKARLLVVSAPHAGDWLMAMPISSCGLRLDNKTVRVAVGLLLGCRLSTEHRCPCGSVVDERGIHGLSCRLAVVRLDRHGALNDVIHRALGSAGVPLVLEPRGLTRSDDRCPDGVTMIPWSEGRCLAWDTTVACRDLCFLFRSLSRHFRTLVCQWCRVCYRIRS